MIALLLILLLSSCMKTEIINAPDEKEETHCKPRKELVSTTDTARAPITFNPSVEDWEETDE